MCSQPFDVPIFFPKNIKTYLYFLLFSKSWYGIGVWNPSSWKKRIILFSTVNIMAADDLATQGSRSSTATVLTYIWIIPSSHQKG